MRSSWLRYMNYFRDTVSTLIVVSVALIALIFGVLFMVNHLSPEPFDPLDPRPLEILSIDPEPGGTLLVRDGLCNITGEPQVVKIYVKMQGQSGNETVTATHDLLGTSTTPESITVYPGCIGTQPVPLTIPAQASPGDYTLTIQATAEGATGEIRNYVRVSNSFRVVPIGDN